MNNIFNIKRMGWLSRWIISTDMKYYRKSAATSFAIIIFIMLMPNLNYVMGGKMDIEFSAGAMFWVLGVCVLVGGGYMMYSYSQWKDGLRELPLPPASNLEKFLMRYLYSLLSQLVIIIGSILIADLLQYVVGWVIGRPDLKFVTPMICDMMGRFMNESAKGGGLLLTIGLWIHTIFMLGANFFRNLKFSWLFTSLFLIILFIVGARVLISCHVIEGGGQLIQFLESHYLLATCLFLVLSVINAWLAYKLFCRRQLVGRFINY